MDFEKLYTENYKNVYYVCFNFLKNQTDAEDMVQNVFIKAFDKIDTLKDVTKFKSWVCQIANRECMNQLKRSGKIVLSDDEKDENFDIEDKSQKSPEDIVVEADVREILLEIINKLPQDQRIAVYLYYYQDMTIKEISEVFNCPEQSTRNRLGYARKNMRKEIEKIENKGIKLRAVSILPFLYYIFQSELENVYADVAIPKCTSTITENGVTEMANNGTKAPQTGTSMTGVAATSGAMAGGVASFFSTVGAKIAIGVASLALVAGVAVAVGGGLSDKDSGSGTANVQEDNAKDDKNQSDTRKDLSHTYMGELGYVIGPESYIKYEDEEKRIEPGKYFFIPLESECDSRYVYVEFDENGGDSEEFYIDEPQMIEIKDNYYSIDVSDWFYIIEADKATEILTGKEYENPAADIDSGKVTICNKEFTLPCKLTEFSGIEEMSRYYINGLLGDEIVVRGDDLLYVPSGVDIDDPSVTSADIVLKPGETICLQYVIWSSGGKKEDSSTYVADAESVELLLMNDSEEDKQLKDCNIHAISVEPVFSYDGVKVNLQNLTPQICLPGDVSLESSMDYVFKQYGMISCNYEQGSNAWHYPIQRGGGFVFLGEEYGVYIEFKSSLSYEVESGKGMIKTITYYKRNDAIDEGIVHELGSLGDFSTYIFDEE